MPASMTEEDLTKKLSLPEAVEFQRYLFGALVVGWSLPTEPSVDEYDALDTASATIVDEKVAEHFETLMPSSAEEK